MPRSPRYRMWPIARTLASRTAAAGWWGMVCAWLLIGAVLTGRSAAATAISFDVEAEAALLLDAETGQILFAKNPDKQMPPASIAKVMTMLLVMEAVDAGRVSLEEPVPVSVHAYNMGGSQVYLEPGEEFTVEEMFEAVAVGSANDASTALAEHLAGTEGAFVDAMNRRAKELGMTNTYFANPHGLPSDPGEPESLTTARDIGIMARELILRHPRVLEYTSIKERVFREEPLFILRNTNDLIWTYPGVDGLKTGHTDQAGWCLVATAERGRIRLISVVLNTASREARDEQSTRLLDYGFNRFAVIDVAEADEVVGEIRRRDAVPERFDVKVPEAAHVMVLRGREGTVSQIVEPLPDLTLPIEAGDRVGRLIVKSEDQELLTVDVVAAEDVHRANLFVRIWRAIRDFFANLFSRG
ncbi:MAG TPA: D-alanyl-D-alanine carboxypeptidase family protein [Limnochordia bacterium]